MNTKPLILNTIMADLSYSIENVERLNELLELDKSQIEVALGILRANRTKLMAILEEQLALSITESTL